MMMTCFETELNLPRYTAGKLSKGEREGLRQHLSVCAGCSERAAEMQDAIQTIRDSFTEVSEPSAQDVPEPLLRAVMTLVASHPASGPSTSAL